MPMITHDQVVADVHTSVEGREDHSFKNIWIKDISHVKDSKYTKGQRSWCTTEGCNLDRDKRSEIIAWQMKVLLLLHLPLLFMYRQRQQSNIDSALVQRWVIFHADGIAMFLFYGLWISMVFAIDGINHWQVKERVLVSIESERTVRWG